MTEPGATTDVALIAGVLDDLRDRSEVLLVDEQEVFPLLDHTTGTRRRLGREIYRWSHLRSTGDPSVVDAVADPQQVDRVAEALGHRTAPSGPWRRAPDGQHLLSPEGVLVVDAFDAAPDDAARLVLPAVLPNRSPGHITVVGSRGARRPGTRGVLRLYVAARPDEALDVLVEVSRILEDGEHHYSCKGIAAADADPRSDTVVAYVDPGLEPTDDTTRALADLAGGLDAATSTSGLVARIGPALGAVWDDEPAGSPGSLGQRMAGHVADALLAVTDSDGSPTEHVLGAATASLVRNVPADDRSWLDRPGLRRS